MPPINARLTWITENGPQTYLLEPGGIVTLGRDPGNDIVIPLGSVSRNHARIEWIGNRYVLSDLGSANGTFVNGQRVGRAPWILQDGDRIKLHVYRLHFELLEKPVEAPEKKQDTEQFFEQQPDPSLPQTAALRPPGLPESDDIFTYQEYAGPVFPPARWQHRLVAFSGLDAGQAFNLTKPVVTIGYASLDADWEIQLNEPSVSRPHARLEKRENVYWLVDLNSEKGTRLNGELARAAVPLKEGDVILLGDAGLIYRRDE